MDSLAHFHKFSTDVDLLLDYACIIRVTGPILSGQFSITELPVTGHL